MLGNKTSGSKSLLREFRSVFRRIKKLGATLETENKRMGVRPVDKPIIETIEVTTKTIVCLFYGFNFLQKVYIKISEKIKDQILNLINEANERLATKFA